MYRYVYVSCLLILICLIGCIIFSVCSHEAQITNNPYFSSTSVSLGPYTAYFM